MPNWSERIDASMARWRGLDSLWRAQAVEVTPSEFDTLADLNARARRFHEIAPAAIQADAAAVAETTAVHREGMAAADEADRMFYEAVATANAALAASREALALGNIEGAEEYQQQAEAAQAVAEDARAVGEQVTMLLDAQLNAARAAREGGMRELIRAAELLSTALDGAGAGVDAAAVAAGNASLIEQAQAALTEVAGLALGGLAGLALIGAGLFVAFRLLKR